MRRFIAIPALVSSLVFVIIVSVAVGYHPPYYPVVPAIPSYLHLGEDLPRTASCHNSSEDYYMHYDLYCYDTPSGAMLDVVQGKIDSVHLYIAGAQDLTLGDVIAEWGAPEYLRVYPSYAPDAYWPDKHVVTTGPDRGIDTPVCCVVYEAHRVFSSNGSYANFKFWRGFADAGRYR